MKKVSCVRFGVRPNNQRIHVHAQQDIKIVVPVRELQPPGQMKVKLTGKLFVVLCCPKHGNAWEKGF